MYLIWDGQIVDADGDPAEVVMYASIQRLIDLFAHIIFDSLQRWLTREHGHLIFNAFVVDRVGIPIHIMPQ